MRLLTVTTLYPNAAQPNHGVFVENRLRHLVSDGVVTSTIVAPVPWFPSRNARFDTWARYAAVPREEVRHGLRLMHPRFAALPRLGMYSGPWMLLRAFRSALRRLRREGAKFDAIDAHYLYPDGVAAAWLAEETGLPLILTARGSDTSLLPSFALPRRLIGAALRRADAVIAVSAGLAEGLFALGADPAKVTVLRNGVDLTTFQPPEDRARLRASFGLSGPALLSVGHLIERKGHKHIIAALPHLPGIKLLIAGEGPQRGALTDLAARLGVAERVGLLGALPHQELSRLYGAADALVLASTSEGWANVMLEAMACGTPVIAGPAWGSREAISAPEAGVVLDAVTPETIASAASQLLAHPPSRAATRAYAERFGWDDTTRGQIELFTRVLAARAGQA
ncbi:glycosyltransferase family 4 protein [Roseomonas sp. HJA6]|uniref:Glycosyltransferase family 4 protein n=1 Tax=Roseomonas alba TaxID=2846776 RepID=A0ABS7A5E8_9PROT|nr:glycosyltransferase family 4 protein [Neoroseomonas alba]